MIYRGRVSPDLAPLVPVDLISNDEQIHTVEMVIDTGFEGDLSLPTSIIQDMGFQPFDDYHLTLANGEEILVAGWEGKVMWRGRRRTVLVVENQSDPLLGMNLLWRNRITIDIHANGPVTIEELV